MEKQHPFKTHLDKHTTITGSEFELILSYFTEKKIGKNTVLIRSAARVPDTYWVKTGLLVSSFTDEDGRDHIIQFATENCWITDQDAFYHQKNAIFDIMAYENCELLCLNFHDREKLCAEIPAMNHFFRRKANDSFVKQQKRLLTYLTADAKKRFDLLMEEYPGIQQRVSKKTMAAYLGVSRETLSRL
ncbi:MAG: Crp/Fnr family transcriptional regulator [Citrobacter freundii]|nr:MAG: Crp/Fnr family transcriptional regulator [Citrobacter freundii]